MHYTLLPVFYGIFKFTRIIKFKWKHLNISEIEGYFWRQNSIEIIAPDYWFLQRQANKTDTPKKECLFVQVKKFKLTCRLLLEPPQHPLELFTSFNSNFSLQKTQFIFSFINVQWNWEVGDLYLLLSYLDVCTKKI